MSRAELDGVLDALRLHVLAGLARRFGYCADETRIGQLMRAKKSDAEILDDLARAKGRPEDQPRKSWLGRLLPWLARRTATDAR